MGVPPVLFSVSAPLHQLWKVLGRQPAPPVGPPPPIFDLPHLRSTCFFAYKMFTELEELERFCGFPDSLAIPGKATSPYRPFRPEWLLKPLWNVADFFSSGIERPGIYILPPERPASEISPLDAANAALRLTNWCDRVLAAQALAAKTTGDTASNAAAPVPSAALAPVVWLTGWSEILQAVGMKKDDREKVKSLNDRLDGPIPRAAKGSQPIVARSDVIEWWNKLGALQQQKANMRDGKLLSVETTHPYGPKADVAPEIAGSIRKRRRSR